MLHGASSASELLLIKPCTRNGGHYLMQPWVNTEGEGVWLSSCGHLGGAMVGDHVFNLYVYFYFDSTSVCTSISVCIYFSYSLFGRF